MVNQRNRIEEITKYIENKGISVNIGKNKARGNKGIFVSSQKRIDVAKGMDENSILSTLIHEFAHFIHYKHDKTLTSLNFIFPEITDDMQEELINVSVQAIPKATATELFQKKDTVNNEIKELAGKIKKLYPAFSLTKPCKEIEKTLTLPEKYLLKYDKVKYFDNVFSIDKLNLHDIKNSAADYLLLKSRQRLLRRINSRISRLNSYYNKPTELIARFIEMYITDNKSAQKIAPNCCKALEKQNFKEINDLKQILCC